MGKGRSTTVRRSCHLRAVYSLDVGCTTGLLYIINHTRLPSMNLFEFYSSNDNLVWVVRVIQYSIPSQENKLFSAFSKLDFFLWILILFFLGIVNPDNIPHTHVRHNGNDNRISYTGNHTHWQVNPKAIQIRGDKSSTTIRVSSMNVLYSTVLYLNVTQRLASWQVSVTDICQPSCWH